MLKQPIIANPRLANKCNQKSHPPDNIMITLACVRCGERADPGSAGEGGHGAGGAGGRHHRAQGEGQITITITITITMQCYV